MEDPGSVQNENGQTELKPKRRISSILKAPRSPLTSIGPINDRVKECPTKPAEKKQRKSRRVSFAETTGVKVFEKDATEITLLNNAAKEVEGEQQKMDAVQDVKRQITGMETLLHAPIQVSQQQFGENYNEQVNVERTTGDRAIVFSGDNEDMDMTYSHTVLINENPASNENPSSSKTGKVDFKDFLSRLNAAKKTDEQLKITKNHNVHRQTSDMEAFICDSNPVTLQKFEKNCNDQFNLQRTMGDKTIVFSSDNNEDMNVTRSHTVLIDENYDKRKSRASTSVKLDFKTLISGVKTSEEDNLSGRRQAHTPYSSSEDQALSGKALAENKSQFTGFLSSINPNGQSASVNLNGPIDNLPVIQPNPPSLKDGKVDFKDFLSRLNAGKSTTAKENSFAASTEMFSFDLDKPWANNANSSLPTNTDSLGVNFFPEKRNVLFEEPDMESTKSHTAAIDDNFMRQLTGQQEDFTGNQRPCSLQPSMSLFPTDQELKRSGTVSKKSVNRVLSESVPGSSFLFPKDQTIVFAGDDNMDMTRSHTVAIDSQSLQHNMTGQSVFGTGREIRCESGKSLKTSSTVENRTERSELGLNLSKNITTHYSQPDEQDDMEMTKSQTVAIDYKDIEAINQQMESTRTSRKSVSGLCSIPGYKTVAFRDEQDDMEMTRSQTVAIDYKDVEAVSNPITWTSRSVGAPVMSLPTDKTVVFSEELDDMDITKCHTVAIDSRSLLQTSAGGKMDCKNMEAVNPLMEICRKPRKSVGGLFSLPADKTVMFTEEQDDMDMTKSLTVAIDCKTIEAVNPLKEFTRKSRSVAGLTFPVVKTALFTEEHDDMDMTKSHTVAIDSKRFMQASGVFSESKSLSKSGQNSALVCDEQDDMEMTRSQTVAIDYKNIEAVNVAAVSSSKRGTPGTIPTDKTVVFSEELDDMDMTKCHTVAIDSTSLLQTSTGGKMDCKNMEAVNPLMEICRKPQKSVGSLFSFPADKTVMFAEEQDDMEMTRSQTVAIDYKDVEAVSNPITWTSRSVGAPVMSLPTDKTVVFSEELDDMDITKCHTVAIDSRSLLQTSAGGKMDCKNMETVNPLMEICRKPRKSVGGLFSFPADKTVMFAEEQDDMEMTRSQTVAIDYKDVEAVSNPITWTSRSVGAPVMSLPTDKTVVFSEELDDMDITKCHTVAIDSRSLLQTSAGGKMDCKNMETVNPLMEICRKPRKSVGGLFSFPADKTVMFAEEQDDMDMTRSQTVAIDYKDVEAVSNPITWTSRSVGAPVMSLPTDKTVVFSEELDDMDITKCHTVAIDSSGLLQTSNGGKMDYKNIDAVNPQMEITRKPKKSVTGLFFLPADKTVMFAEEHDDMDMTKSHTAAIDSRVLSESSSKEKIDCKNLETVNPLFGTRKSRKSVAGICSLPADRTVMFAEENDDMDMTKSYTVAIDSKSILQAPNKETTVLESTLSLCKSDLSAVLLSDEQEDMEITRSKTVAIDYKNIDLNCELVMGISRKSAGLASHPSDKTVVFSGEENDMEITKSHTVAIDGSSFEASAKQNLIMPNKPGRASSLQINWISQNKKTEDEMEMTRSHTVCIDDQLPMETRGIYSVASSSDNRTVVFSSEQDDMDITRSNTVAIDSKDLQTTKNVRESVLTAPNEQNSVFSGGENMSANRGIGGSNDNSAHLNNKKKNFDPEKQEAEVVDSKDKIDAAHVSNQTAKLKRKSVSFRFPEHELDSEREVKIICTDPTTELNCLNTILLENTESFRCQTLNKELTETVHVDKASENLNMGNDDEHAPHQPPMVESDGNISLQKTSFCEESIFTGEEPLLVATKARRRSLADIHSKLKSIRKIYEECPEKEMSSHTAPLPLQVIELKPENTDRKKEDALSNKSCRNENKSFADKSEFMEEAPEEPRDQPLESSFVLGDQTRNVTTPVNFSKETPQTKRVSLGVFRPKLPNKKRPHSSEGFLDDSNPTKLTGYHLFGKHLTKTAGLGALEDASRPQSTFSLVENLHEEILPEFNDEMDSAESLNSEFPTSCYDETKPMEELQKKSNTEDSFFVCPEPVGTRGQKRPLPEDSSEDKMLIESTEKRRSQDGVSSNREQVTKYTSQWDSSGEGIAAENPPSMLAKTLDSTNSSSNTLNFTKCDSTFGDLSEQRYSQMESQFLDGDRYEHNLREKCLDGSITVKEFLQVLGVNILIQRPRQSQLPPKFATDAAPTPEDWLNEMYVYRPQLKVYEEDCQALYETVEKLKKRNCDQEKSLRSLNEPLWKMVKTYSEEQLRSLGLMLNERKSDFRRKSKMLSHERKVGLYSKLLQSAQSEQKKLEDKITMTDKLLSDLDECMSSLEAEATNMDLFEVEDDDHSISELELAVKAMEEEFEHLKTQEANIEREQLNLYSEQKNMKSKLCKLQEKKRQLEMSIQELSSLAEWTLSEWLDERAVFTFLNGSLELELIFGEPIDGVQFNGKPGKKILDIKVYTLLDDEAAPSSSLVAHKLITQFFESKGSLCQKYTTQQDLQKLLLDISLVVCRCRLLGEELHYLQKNGPAKFEILEMVILNTDIKIIFSSFKAFAKFEITLSLTPVYPASRLHLSSFKNYIGNASCDQVEQIISTVKPANSYLTRIVEKIHQNLLTKEHPWNTVC